MAEKTANPETALAKRYKRIVASEAGKTYRRLLRQFQEDAECDEAAAKKWLASIDIDDPSPTKKWPTMSPDARRANPG